jgi:2'-5' RNA ligase
MRLFVAIHVPERIRTTIAILLDEFRLIDPELKWIKSENLHITLKFLGKTDASQLDAVVKALSTIARSAHPITFNFAGLGFFPNARRPNILWTGIQASANAQVIVQEIDQALAVLGFPLQQREFTPHLTLGRFEKRALSRNMQSAIERNASGKFGGFTATEFHLIQSKLNSSGAEYTILHSFPFMAEA